MTFEARYPGHCHCHEQFLDGYRHGLGDAARNIDIWATRAQHPAMAATLIADIPPCADIPEVVGGALRAAAIGLRMLSASTQLVEEQ